KLPTDAEEQARKIVPASPDLVQGDDECAVPEGPGREDAPRAAPTRGSWQGWWRTVLRLSRRAYDDRDDGVHRRARDSAHRRCSCRAHLPGVRQRTIAEADREDAEPTGSRGTVRRQVEAEHSLRTREARHRNS